MNEVEVVVEAANAVLNGGARKGVAKSGARWLTRKSCSERSARGDNNNNTMIELDFSNRPYRLLIHAQAFLPCGACPVPRTRLSSLQGSWTPRR